VSRFRDLKCCIANEKMQRSEKNFEGVIIYISNTFSKLYFLTKGNLIFFKLRFNVFLCTNIFIFFGFNINYFGQLCSTKSICNLSCPKIIKQKLIKCRFFGDI